jgi:L-ribulose-5-phosphate 4-epimerase
MKEGVIKFNISHWIKIPNLVKRLWINIENTRIKLHQLKLIGYDEINKVGYGNISERSSDSEFIITASQTGKLEKLNEDNFSIIIATNFNTNSVACYGPAKPSSESITHAACYYNNPAINAVIHIHSPLLWKRLYNENFDSTPENAEFGSVELSEAIAKIVKSASLEKPCLVVMKGHKDGIIIAGKTMEETSKYLLDIYNAYR